jgi:predicted nucleotidyltransferase
MRGDLVKEVTEAVTGHPAITAVRLAGSRARGDEVPLSDWDCAIDAYEAARTRQENRLGVAVDRALGSEVRAAVERGAA